jgi:hypothetical protein
VIPMRLVTSLGFFVWMASVALPGIADTVSVEIRFGVASLETSSTNDRALGTGVVALRPVLETDRGTSPTEPQRIAIPGKTIVELSRPGLWQVEVVSPGFWSEPEPIWVDGEGVSSEILLWPTGGLKGQLSMPTRSDETPSVLRVAFRGERKSKHTSRQLTGEVQCPVVDSHWRCEIPAGTMDLRIKAPGHVSDFFWSQQIEQGQDLDLGMVKPRDGASIFGWVERMDGARPAPSTQIIAEPLARRSSHLGQELGRLVPTTGSIDGRGFFQITGVTPGSYSVVARDGVHADARMFPVLVFENADVELRRSLVLAPPRMLNVVVNPPTDSLERPWHVRLYRTGSNPANLLPEAEGQATGLNEWAWKDLGEGTYVIKVLDGEQAIWHSTEVGLGGEDLLHFVDIDSVPVVGELTLGDVPLQASVWFGGRRGSTRVELISDEEGRFQGLLPKEGDWTVEVVADRPRAHRFLESVEVRRTGGSGKAYVELSLPATFVGGEVVDSAGHAVPNAIVIAMSLENLERPFYERTDKQGEFEFRGLAVGEVLLMAEAPGMATEGWIRVHLLDRNSSAQERLVLHPIVEVQGRVVSPSGPVAGATIDAVPVQSPVAGVSPVITGTQGRFTARVPPGTTEVFVRVAAPGFAFRISRRPVQLGEETVFHVNQYGGELVLTVGEMPASGFSGKKLILLHKGGFVGSPQLLAWAAINGARQTDMREIVVPNLESGEYSACMLTHQELAQLYTGVGSLESCVLGFLPPLGVLSLSMDDYETKQQPSN